MSGIANDSHGRFHGDFIDGAGFNGAVRGTHTAGNVATLKGRTGRAGAAHQEITVAEDQLSIGSQIDEQTHLILVPDTGGQCACGDIAAYVGADIRRDQNRCQRVGRQLQIPCQQPLPTKEAGDVGIHSDGIRIYRQQQVVHGGIGTDGKTQDAVGRNTGRFAEVGNDGVQRLLDNGILKLFGTAGAALLNDAVDHISAVADLAVTGGAFRQQLAGFQVGEHHGDGGGTNIDGTAGH